jgi:polysaccharide export outer membrane protein
MTRDELSASIKKSLLDKKLLEDNPLVVTVEFANLNISVLGEVNRPGRYAIDKDKVTLLDALGMAGDITIFGERNRVIVMRQDGEKQKMFEIDLTSIEKLVNSPVYYVQQNDVVYVRPNSMRQRQATVSGNTVYTPTFWISVASLLTTVTAIIINNN